MKEKRDYVKINAEITRDLYDRITESRPRGIQPTEEEKKRGAKRITINRILGMGLTIISNKRGFPAPRKKQPHRLEVLNKKYGKGFTEHGFLPVPRPLLACFVDLGFTPQLRDFIIYILAFGNGTRKSGVIIAADAFLAIKMKYSRRQIQYLKRKLEKVYYKGKPLVTIEAPYINPPKGMNHPYQERTTYDFSSMIEMMNSVYQKRQSQLRLTQSS